MMNSLVLPDSLFITKHNRSFGQGNVFTPICLFTGGVYIQGGLPTWGFCLQEDGLPTGVCLGGLYPGGSDQQGGGLHSGGSASGGSASKRSWADPLP